MLAYPWKPAMQDLPESLRIFIKKTGLDPRSEVSDEQFELLSHKLALAPSLFDDSPFLFFKVVQHRDTLVDDLRRGGVPEGLIKGIAGKMSIRVSLHLTRAFAFWRFADGSGFMREESKHWKDVAPILDRLFQSMSAGLEQRDANAIMAQLAPVAQSAKALSPRLVPLSPEAMSQALERFALPGDFAKDHASWRDQFELERFPQAPLTPAIFASICKANGYL
jgi:hypothetical protein